MTPKRTIPQKETRLRTTSTEEKDEEEHLNSTQNPLEDTELSVLISTITGDTDNGTWINSKSTMATAIQVEINREKEVSYLWKNKSPKNSTNTWTFSLKKKWHDSPNLRHGTTRSK